MPEKNLLASFSDLRAAKHCQQALRDQGFDVVDVNILAPYSGDSLLPHAPLVEWGRSGYQVDRLQDKWTTGSAWTDSQTGMIEGGSWLLTAVVPADGAERAAHVIKQYGGSL